MFKRMLKNNIHYRDQVMVPYLGHSVSSVAVNGRFTKKFTAIKRIFPRVSHRGWKNNHDGIWKYQVVRLTQTSDISSESVITAKNIFFSVHVLHFQVIIYKEALTVFICNQCTTRY